MLFDEGEWLLTASGIPYSRTVASVITPSVPSDPINRFVKLYPAADFLQETRKSAMIIQNNF